jgi:hypothetical protein
VFIYCLSYGTFDACHKGRYKINIIIIIIIIMEVMISVDDTMVKVQTKCNNDETAFSVTERLHDVKTPSAH